MKAFCTRVVGVPKRSQGINGLNVTYHDLRCVCVATKLAPFQHHQKAVSQLFSETCGVTRAVVGERNTGLRQAEALWQ